MHLNRENYSTWVLGSLKLLSPVHYTLMSETDGFSFGSPPLATRRDGPFLDAEMIPSDNTCSERSSRQESRIFSESPQRDESPGDPVPIVSTPDLSFAASSSPFLSSMRESPSLRPTSFDHSEYGTLSALRKLLTPDHASFVHRLDYLLREAVEQSGTICNPRIQCASPEDVLGSKLQTASIALGTSSDPLKHCSSSSVLPLRELQRRTSLDGRDYAPSTVSCDPGYNSRRNKRKASSATDRVSKTASESPIHNRSVALAHSSSSYLSASDCASPPSRYRDVRYPPFKKRKCFSFDCAQVSIISSCAKSVALSKVTILCSKSSSFPRREGSCSDLAREGSKGVEFAHATISASISFIFQGELDTGVTALYHFRSTSSVLSYPLTQPATRVSSPVPILAPQDFLEADIPRVYGSNEGAAEARLRVLLKKETFHRQREGPSALTALDLAPLDSFVIDVIKWILRVFASMLQVLLPTSL